MGHASDEYNVATFLFLLSRRSFVSPFSGVGDLLGGLNLSNPAPSSSTLSSTEPLASSGVSASVASQWMCGDTCLILCVMCIAACSSNASDCVCWVSLFVSLSSVT